VGANIQDLISRDSLKTVLGISGTAQDGELEFQLTAASFEIAAYLGRYIDEADSRTWCYVADGSTLTVRTEAVGPDCSWLWLPTWPVSSIVSIYYDANEFDFTDSDNLIDSDYYNLAPRGYIRRVGGTWGAESDSIEVKFRGGYPSKRAIDLSSVANTDTVTITSTVDGVLQTALTYTKAASTVAASRQFADAAGLVTCINDATHGVSGVTASASGNVVTLAATTAGRAAVMVEKTENAGTLAISIPHDSIPLHVQQAAALLVRYNLQQAERGLVSRVREGLIDIQFAVSEGREMDLPKRVASILALGGEERRFP